MTTKEITCCVCVGGNICMLHTRQKFNYKICDLITKFSKTDKITDRWGKKLKSFPMKQQNYTLKRNEGLVILRVNEVALQA